MTYLSFVMGIFTFSRILNFEEYLLFMYRYVAV